MPVIFATDILVYLIFAFAVYLTVASQRNEYVRGLWRQVRSNRLAVVSLVVLSLYGAVALADSIRWRDALTDDSGKVSKSTNGGTIYSPQAPSLLDRALWKMRTNTETTFSAPMADRHFVKKTIEKTDGTTARDYPPLKYPSSHLLGTDKVGDDVFFAAIKGIRTGIVIGTGTTLIMIPFAILFGVLAGYYGGRVDDLIQYIYTTLSSLPGILLIVSFMLLFGMKGYQGGLVTDKNLVAGVFIFNERLLWLCVILGITGWTGLCRLVRGETLKLRELEYVQAARSFGVSGLRILTRHIVPNVMHLALITFVLDFSGLVLTEAILSYLQIGVGPEMGSWGNMVNAARLELSREPVVWWSLLGAFAFMFGLVLPANIFGDAVRDALDPRLRTK